MLKVYGLPTQNNGCAKYRLWQPLEMLSRLGLAEVRRDPDEPQAISAERADDIFRWADVVVCQPFSELWAAGLIVAARDTHKKKLVVDLDDNIYAVHPLNIGVQNGKLFYVKNRFSGGFEDYWDIEDISEDQIQEYGKRLDGTVFKADGQLRFLRNKEPDGRLVANAMLESADMVTTTNEHLQGVFRTVTKSPVAVLPNCLDFKEWERPRAINCKTWLGWSGSVSHYPDLKPLMPVFDEVIAEHSTVNFHIMGSSFDYFFPPKPNVRPKVVPGYHGQAKDQMCEMTLEDCTERWPGRMKFDKPVTIQEYVPWFSGTFLADIAVAPLEDNDFNASKSELKWIENSALGIPTIASKVGPYKRAIRHGEDGLLCTYKNSWRRALDELISSPERRKQIGDAARERAHQDYDSEKRAPEWLHLYEAIV
jgi:glycosyltransferase involved in cell wall biosynthesis